MANAIMTAKNTFGDGLLMDLAPDNTQATCLSNALNATLVTMNGNELSLQNDMGNGRVETAYLPEGYVPVGTCEFGDIIYIVSYNPLTNKSQIGCFPSPERNISSEEMGDQKQTLSMADFIKDGEVVTSSVKKILCSKDLNPGDKFIVYSDNLEDSNTVITDYGNTSETLYTFPKEMRISLVAIEDSGKINYLDSTLKWYGSGDNTYYINKGAKNGNKPDLDSYRNLLNSGYSVFQSKVSGKLAILAELERIDSFDCTYSVYKIEPKIKEQIDNGNIEYINYSIYLNCNWKTSNNDVNPIKMQIFNGAWVGNQIKHQDGKIEKKGGTYPLLKTVTNKREENTNIGKVDLPEDLKKIKDIDFTFPDNYISQNNRSSYKKFVELNYDHFTKDLSIHKLTQAIDEGVPYVGHYYIDLAQIVDNKYYNSELKELLKPTEISDMIVNNFYKGSVYKQLVSDIQIPNIQLLKVDEKVQRFNIDKKDLIIKFDVAPVMTYGTLKDLTNTLYIDFSKVGTGTIELKGYKYYIGSNLCTLSLGTEIYPEENKGVSEILLEFYDNQGLCATYHINDRESYSGNITEYIPLNGESTNYKLSALKDDGNPIFHAGIKDINGSVVLQDGKPALKSEKKAENDKEDTYQNDAGILYSNMLYAVKITIKYRSKNVLGEYESSSDNDKSEWRWLWTNTMFNDYYYTVKDFKDNQFTLDLDITANYYPEYKTNQRVIYENSTKNLDGNNINKGLGTSIQNLDGNIKYQIDLGLQNNYSMFSLNGSKDKGVFANGVSTINIYLGDNYISYGDKDLKQLTTDNYDISAIEPSYQKYDSELTKKYKKLINYETITDQKDIWDKPESYKDTIQISFDKTGTANKIEYLGYDQEIHTTTNGIHPTLSSIHTSSNTKGSLNIDLWTFNKYLKLYQSTKTEAPVIQSLLLADNNRWGLKFGNNTVQFKNIYTFSTITLGDDDHDEGSVVTLVDKWKDGTTMSTIKSLMFDRVFYRRRTGHYSADTLNRHKEYAQVRLAYNRKDDGNTNFSPYKNGNFMYFLHDTVNADSSLYTLEENQFFLNIVYPYTGNGNSGRFGLSQGDRSRNTNCFQSDSALNIGLLGNFEGEVLAQIGFMSNQGIYLLNDYIFLNYNDYDKKNIYVATQFIANTLASLLADSYVLSTSNGSLDVNTLLEFIHYNYKTLYTQDLVFNASIKSDNDTLNIHGITYSDYLNTVLKNSSTEVLKSDDVNVSIQYNSITKNIPIQLEVNSIAPIQYNNSSYVWKSVSDNSDVVASNIGQNQIYYISQDKQLLPIGDNQVFSRFDFISDSEATRTGQLDVAQLYSAFSYKNGLQITPSSATYCQVGGDVEGKTIDLPVLRELPLDSKMFKSNDPNFLHARF